MSELGGDITPQDMDNMINKFNKEFVLTPRIDIVSGLKKLAIETAPLGFGAKEIEDLMRVALLKQIENSDKSLDQITDAITTSLFGGSPKGLQALSFRINDELIKQKAQELKLWEEIDGQMSATVRQQTVYFMLLEQTLGKQEALLIAQENGVFAATRANKQWEDFKENLGSIFAPMWNNLVEVWENAIIKANNFFDITEKGFKALMPYVLVLQDYAKLILASVNPVLFQGLIEDFIKKYSGGVGKVIEEYKKDLDSIDLSTSPDTPTGEKPPLEDITGVETDKTTKDIQSLIEWLDNLGDKARKLAEDFAQSFSRMQADFNEKVLRFMEDWDIARERLIEDSNRNTEKKNKEHFDREYWEYLKFQERLRQLREKYLFNLEDALRERDARQVLRLGSQYAMDVNDATKQYELAKAEREARRRDEEAEEARELADRLARLDEDRQLQLDRMKEDQALKEARAQEDHRIAMDRLDDEIEDKLRKLADTWAEQFGLDRDGAEDIYDMLNRFYGRGGLINNLFFYTYENLINTSDSTYSALQNYVSKYLELAKKMEDARNDILSEQYRNIMPHPGLYDAKFNMPKMPSSVPVVAKTVEVVKNTMVVDMNLSPELQFRIRQQVLQDVNDVLIRFNKTRSM